MIDVRYTSITLALKYCTSYALIRYRQILNLLKWLNRFESIFAWKETGFKIKLYLFTKVGAYIYIYIYIMFQKSAI